MKRWMSISGLILVTIIWGGGFVASDIALESLTPFQIMTGRFFLGALCMSIMSIKTMKNTSKKELQAGILMGIALFLGFAFQTVGLQYTTPSKNAFLTALNVVMVPFIAYVLLHKKVGKKGMLGAILSVIGVGLLSLNGDFKLGIGDFYTILCAVSFAFQIFLTGQYVKKCSVMNLNCIQMVTSFLLSVCSLFVFKETEIQWSSTGTLSILYLGIISTTLCFMLQTACQKNVDETKAAIILSMESVFGTLFSVILLHEVLSLRMMVGCVIILIAVIISNMADVETV